MGSLRGDLQGEAEQSFCLAHIDGHQMPAAPQEFIRGGLGEPLHRVCRGEILRESEGGDEVLRRDHIGLAPARQLEPVGELLVTLETSAAWQVVVRDIARQGMPESVGTSPGSDA